MDRMRGRERERCGGGREKNKVANTDRNQHMHPPGCEEGMMRTENIIQPTEGRRERGMNLLRVTKVIQRSDPV